MADQYVTLLSALKTRTLEFYGRFCPRSVRAACGGGGARRAAVAGAVEWQARGREAARVY